MIDVWAFLSKQLKKHHFKYNRQKGLYCYNLIPFFSNFLVISPNVQMINAKKIIAVKDQLTQLRKDSLKTFRYARIQTHFPLMWGNGAVVELLAVVLI